MAGYFYELIVFWRAFSYVTLRYVTLCCNVLLCCTTSCYVTMLLKFKVNGNNGMSVVLITQIDL